MVKELIRNGGFERGNLDFWKITKGSAVVVSDIKKRGEYSAKLKCGTDNYVFLCSKDYIAVIPFAVYKFTGWIKSVSYTSAQIYITVHDSDYQDIPESSFMIWSKSGTFDWTFAEGWFVAPIEASYLTLHLHNAGASFTYGYVDSLSLQEVDLSRIAVYTKELLKKTNFTSTGTFYSDEYFSGIWKYGEFYLDVSSLTGSSPTLDITIQAFDPSTELWKDIVVFDQATGADTQLKVATAGLGWKIRVKYVTGGSLTDCDFTVGAIFKR